jgi:hypothetical protein
MTVRCGWCGRRVLLGWVGRHRRRHPDYAPFALLARGRKP